MNDNNESTQGKQFRVLDFEPNRPDCAVAVGEPHEYDEYDGGCDVARCLVTGPAAADVRPRPRLRAETSGPDDGPDWSTASNSAG